MVAGGQRLHGAGSAHIAVGPADFLAEVRNTGCTAVALLETVYGGGALDKRC